MRFSGSVFLHPGGPLFVVISKGLWYNRDMEKIDVTGLSPEVKVYISSLESNVSTLTEKVGEQERQIDHLHEIVDKLQKMKFGQQSEKSRFVMDNADQMSFFNEAEKESNAKAPEPTEDILVEAHIRKPKRTKEELSEGLPIKEIICELPDEERVCGVCGAEMKPIGKEYVRTELEFVPAQASVIKYYRMTYACSKCEKESGEANLVKAEVPAPVMKKSLASASTVAYTMYQKYVNGMPLYRQEQEWKTYGLALSRATLANWVIRPSEQWLKPLYEIMRRHMLLEPVIHADETEVQVLKEPGRAAKTASRMWIYCTGKKSETPMVLYEYQPTRSGEHAKRWLAGFKGYLVTDGYAGYNSVPYVTHCYCWAHVRRHWVDAMPKTDDKNCSTAAIGVEYCNRLFTLEEKLEEKSLSTEEWEKARQEEVKPLLDAYWSWLEDVDALEGSALGKAVKYSCGLRDGLNAFFVDSRISLSNNLCENHIRPFVVGRKNWMFCDTTKGAEASALCYSVLETAKANGLNVYLYLLYLLTEMPKAKVLDDDVLERCMPWSPTIPKWCRQQ